MVKCLSGILVGTVMLAGCQRPAPQRSTPTPSVDVLDVEYVIADHPPEFRSGAWRLLGESIELDVRERMWIRTATPANRRMNVWNLYGPIVVNTDFLLEITPEAVLLETEGGSRGANWTPSVGQPAVAEMRGCCRKLGKVFRKATQAVGTTAGNVGRAAEVAVNQTGAAVGTAANQTAQVGNNIGTAAPV
jgi:hypothetical protein